MLSVDGLGFAYAEAAVLDHISFDVAEGEIVALLGPSGCGKSTVLRLVAGLMAPAEGRIDWRGMPGRIGFVFQDAALMPWANVRANVELPLSLKGRGDAVAVSEALIAIGLGGYENRMPHTLSGGQRMRVSIARALAAQPELMLMDEPFAALDEILRFQMNRLLLELTAERRWGCLFVTHSLYEAAFLADRVLVMHQGRIAGQIRPGLDRTLTPADQRASAPFMAAVAGIGALLEGGQ